MYQNACGAAAASAGGCVETDKDCQGLIAKEPTVPVVEHDYGGFDIVKATQVQFVAVFFVLLMSKLTEILIFMVCAFIFFKDFIKI